MCADIFGDNRWRRVQTVGLYVETGRGPSHAMGRGIMSRCGFCARGGEVCHRGGRRHACRLYMGEVETLRRNDFEA